MAKCYVCNHREGTVQMFIGVGGRLVPHSKMCDHCNRIWRNAALMVTEIDGVAIEEEADLA